MDNPTMFGLLFITLLLQPRNFLPSAAIWICENFRRSISAMAKPVKQEKRNIYRACSAPLSFTFSAMSLATPLFCKKRIFRSSFS